MKMKQLLIVLSFCTFAYGFTQPGYLTSKEPQPDPDQKQFQREGLTREVQGAMNNLIRAMNYLIRKFHSLILINTFQHQPMPFSRQVMSKLNTGVFTPKAWLKMFQNGI